MTDANGNYLFGSVHPGIYVIRWDLSNFTTDFRITGANQGGDDALDSDGVSGEVCGFVFTAEIEFPGGPADLNVDFGLVETLPAIQAAARENLTTALVNYLLANDYTAGNWTALNTARTDGFIAINAATDPAGVATAKDSALAAMAAVATVAQSLTFAEITRTDEGQVTLVLKTTPNFLLTLQSSTDLKSWTTNVTATPATGLWTFVHDATLAIGPRRFYRAFFRP